MKLPALLNVSKVNDLTASLGFHALSKDVSDELETSPDRQIEDGGEVKLERDCRRCRRNRRGAAVVEFAVVAPVFFAMILGMIECGRAIMVQQILTNAAREGARVAVLDSTTPTASLVTSKVTTYLQGCGITGATVTITPTEPTTAGYGQPVTVAVQLPFSSVSWLPSPWFIPGTKVLKASSVMRRETVQ
jgi:hypothetical protein